MSQRPSLPGALSHDPPNTAQPGHTLWWDPGCGCQAGAHPQHFPSLLWLMPFLQWRQNKSPRVKIWFRGQDTWGVCIFCVCWLALCRILKQDALGTPHTLGSAQAENMLCVPEVAKKARGLATHCDNFEFMLREIFTKCIYTRDKEKKPDPFWVRNNHWKQLCKTKDAYKLLFCHILVLFHIK